MHCLAEPVRFFYLYSMKKDTYYFSHDYNASNDEKVLLLRTDLGMEGYGIYWYLVESLANSGGHLPIKVIPLLSTQMGSTIPKVKAVIKNYNLFQIIDGQFFSDRLLHHLGLRKALSDAGRIGANNRWANGVAIRDANGVAIRDANAKEIKGKESKGNETKGNELFTISDTSIEKARMMYASVKLVNLPPDRIKQLFDTWLPDNHNGRSQNEIEKHFINWLKTQKITVEENTHGSSYWQGLINSGTIKIQK